MRLGCRTIDMFIETQAWQRVGHTPSFVELRHWLWERKRDRNKQPKCKANAHACRREVGIRQKSPADGARGRYNELAADSAENVS
jgi:hypothetical protein